MTGDMGLTPKQAAEKIGMSLSWVYKAASSGDLPSFRPSPRSNALRFRAEALEEWMRARERIDQAQRRDVEKTAHRAAAGLAVVES